MRAPTRFDSSRYCQLQSGVGHTPEEEPRRPPPSTGTVKARAKISQKFCFGGQCSGFVGASTQFDRRDRAQQSQMTAPHTIWIGHAVAGQAFSEIPRFTDVEHTVIGIAH
jgi:hypothetical protein